jgi:hypothetical protein
LLFKVVFRPLFFSGHRNRRGRAGTFRAWRRCSESRDFGSFRLYALQIHQGTGTQHWQQAATVHSKRDRHMYASGAAAVAGRGQSQGGITPNWQAQCRRRCRLFLTLARRGMRPRVGSFETGLDWTYAVVVRRFGEARWAAQTQGQDPSTPVLSCHKRSQLEDRTSLVAALQCSRRANRARPCHSATGMGSPPSTATSAPGLASNYHTTPGSPLPPLHRD